MTRLSLAVAALRPSPSDLERYIDEVSGSGLGPDDEVVIAAATDEPERLQETVRSTTRALLLAYPPDTTPMRLWGHAMARAGGTHVAVLDARDGLGASWLRGWAASPREQLVCGPVDPEGFEGRCSWAAYFSEYGQFKGPLDATRLEEVPGNNLVLPRELMPPADDLEQHGFWKTFHLERLKSQLGELPITVSNDMVVLYRRSYRLRPYLGRRLLHGRCYGARRLDEANAPPRLACLAFTPTLPLLRTYRVLRRVRNSKAVRRHLAGAGLSLVLGEAAWALGEALGYARGAGDACERLW